MDDLLKQLLETELKAEAIVKDADSAREKILREARAEAKRAEDNFADRIANLQKVLNEKAEQRATQTIAESKKRFEERCQKLQSLAHSREQEAVEAALAIILNTETPKK
jgi:V/A-type H+-transporting ATPase subunit G/H